MGYARFRRELWIIFIVCVGTLKAQKGKDSSVGGGGGSGGGKGGGGPEPSFLEPLQNVTVAIGRDARMPCVIDNLGKFKVAWIRVESKAVLTIHKHVITRNYRVNLSNSDPKTFTLQINNVRDTDRGGYMCQINTAPMKSQIAYLNVVVPPDIIDRESSADVLVREGSNITLICRAKGHPKPTITWRREDGQVIAIGNWQDNRFAEPTFEGAELSITKVSRLHMGAYLCIASNNVPPSVSRRILLQVHFPPMIWIPNQLVGAPVGGEVTLDCHTEAYPMSINYWTRDHGDMIVSSDKYSLAIKDKTYKIHMKLTIRAVRTDDFGTYKCFAKNSLGSTEGSIRLYEIHVPFQNGKESSTTKTQRINEINFGMADDTLTKEPRLDIQPLPNQPEPEAASSKDDCVSSFNYPFFVTLITAIVILLN